MSLLTCREFLQELTDYLDEAATPDVRQEVEAHINECPNCWVVFDTTKKTLQIYKGMDPQPIPEQVHTRLMDAIQKRMSHNPPSTPDCGEGT